MKLLFTHFVIFAQLSWVWMVNIHIRQSNHLVDLRSINLESEPTPSPTYDPLKEPVLPENPNEVEYGEYLYYYHCMPCHGDQGQGLTDEFRQVWVEDHQNCWARGCHGGRPQDEGFPIPTYVPRVMADADALGKYTSFDSLLTYLYLTHPPQYPGKLEVDEYQALTAFLWDGNKKPTTQPALRITLASESTQTPQVMPATSVLPDKSALPPLETLGADLSEKNYPTDSENDGGQLKFLLFLGGGIALVVFSFLVIGIRLRKSR